MKQKLRETLLAKRESMDEEEARQRSARVIKKLVTMQEYIDAKTVMFYVSKGREVHTHALLLKALRERRVLVPKVVDDGLMCSEIKSFAELKKGKFGVLEPENEGKCNFDDIDLILVPGIAFDKEGHRIGYGMGYYDGLLKEAKCPKIGLAYSFQMVENIPADEWDVAVDRIITD